MIHIRYVRVHVYGNTITKKIWYGFTDTKHTHADTRASFLSVSHARARVHARNTQIREIHTREKKSDYHIDENDAHTWEERRVRSGMKKKGKGNQGKRFAEV